MKTLLRNLSVLTVLFVSAAEVPAQLPPPISPWMSMFQRQTGPLDQYHAFVKPQQDAMRHYQQQQKELNQSQQALQTMQNQQLTGSSGSIDLAGRASGSLDPNRSLLAAPQEIRSGQGNPAYYNNTLHYYQNTGQSRVPNFSPTGANRRR